MQISATTAATLASGRYCFDALRRDLVIRSHLFTVPVNNLLFKGRHSYEATNQSINVRFVGHCYTTRPGAPTIVSCKHDQKVWGDLHCVRKLSICQWNLSLFIEGWNYNSHWTSVVTCALLMYAESYARKHAVVRFNLQQQVVHRYFHHSVS